MVGDSTAEKGTLSGYAHGSYTQVSAPHPPPPLHYSLAQQGVQWDHMHGTPVLQPGAHAHWNALHKDLCAAAAGTNPVSG